MFSVYGSPQYSKAVPKTGAHVNITAPISQTAEAEAALGFVMSMYRAYRTVVSCLKVGATVAVLACIFPEAANTAYSYADRAGSKITEYVISLPSRLK